MGWTEVKDNKHDFKINAELSGVLIEKEPNEEYGGYNYFISKNAEETVKVFGTKILNNKLRKVEIGDVIKIEYLGIVQSKKKDGNEYHDFKVLKYDDDSRKEETLRIDTKRL